MENASAATDCTKSKESADKKARPAILRRHVRVRDVQPSKLVAYDLETTRIAQGTPRPLYLTVFAESPAISVREAITDIAHLRRVIVERMLTPDLVGARFVAWNANNFDAYLIAAALIIEPGYVVRPFLTRSKNLRGMLVIVKGDEDLKPKQQRAWYFLDGIAMTGLAGVSLEKFLRTFAPDHQKLTGVINWDVDEFDATNPDHCDYAMRDSEGLWHGITRAEEILMTYFNEALGVTMGRSCIKILTANIPERTEVIQPDEDVLKVIRDYVMRGGYCYCVRPYHGPVWKYDINQAYAAAMREAKLPAGRAYRGKTVPRFAATFLVRITARNPKNRVPFYFKTTDHNGRVRSFFSATDIPDTWITSIEYHQLVAEHWTINVLESISFEDSFSLTDYVNKLEHIRMTCEGGPSGAIGTMIKAVGNHSYGKTVEQLDPLELVIALDCPEGFAEYFPDEPFSEFSFPHIWYRLREVTPRQYHQPHVGSFVTAHVRMVVRRAALIRPESWLYADTDCVMFDSDVTAELDIDPKRYGAWKLEASGDVYKLIAKKVYASDDGGTRHAKGLNVKKLTSDDFDSWYLGQVPEQTQTQRNNFIKVMRGADMFLTRKRRGTDASKTRVKS